MKIRYFLKNEFSYQFQSGFVFYGYLIGIFINLIVYYYTSKAFAPTLTTGTTYLKNGYFEFIILGELCLLVAQISISEGQDAFFRYKESGLVECFYFSKTGLLRSLFYLYLSLVVVTSIYFISTIIFSQLFFSMSLTLSQVLRLSILQFLSALFFLGLFLFNLSLSALIGRRNGSIQHIVNLLTFFSGAYFPLDLISSELVRGVLRASPFALIIDFARSFVYNGKFFSYEFFMLIVWLMATLFCAFLVYLFKLKKNGLGTYVSP